jgi:hypothetical protein
MTAVTLATGYPVQVLPNTGLKAYLFYFTAVTAADTVDVSSYLKTVLFAKGCSVTNACTTDLKMTGTGNTTLTWGAGPAGAAGSILAIGLV